MAAATKTDNVSSEQLSQLKVFDEKGEPVILSQLWQTQPAVLYFVRHFGWVLCRQQVADLAEYEQQFVDKNSRLVVIGPGESKHLVGFRKATGYRSELFADPSRASFQILGFVFGIGGLIGIKPIQRVFSALSAGHRPGSLQGSALQLGGAAVIDTEGTIRLLIREKQAGDHPPVAKLLEALP